MIFDTHTHYDDEQFDTDREELLLSLKEQGVGADGDKEVQIKANLSSENRQGKDTNKKPVSCTNVDSVCVVWVNAKQRPLGNKGHVCFPFTASAPRYQ